MGGKTAIALGLVAGVAAGGLLVGGLVAFTPGPAGPASTATPAPPSPAPSATGAPSPTVVPSAPGASPSDGAPSGAPSGALSPSPSTLEEAFGIGEPAPPLRLPRLGGGTVDLADLRGRPVWVNFMGSYCPPCVDELPLMRGFAARYADAGLEVVLVDVREDEATVGAFLDSFGVTFPTGLDAAGDASRAWGALALPVHVWVDGDGIIREGALGGIGPDVMAQGLGAILPGVTVTP